MDRRTSIITAAAVFGTLAAGTGAIAANIGVLRSADDDSIGNLSAEAAVEAPTSSVAPEVVDVYIEEPPVVESTLPPTTVEEVAEPTVQEFAVESAGSVGIEQRPTGLFVTDVQANQGWSWTTARSSSNDFVVTFTSGDTTYEFVAGVGPDGSLEARVDQPIVQVVQIPAPAAPAPAAPTTGSSGGSTTSGGYEDDDYDDDDYDDDDYDEDDYDDGHDDDGDDDYDDGDDEHDDDDDDHDDDDDDDHEGGDDDD